MNDCNPNCQVGWSWMYVVWRWWVLCSSQWPRRRRQRVKLRLNECRESLGTPSVISLIRNAMCDPRWIRVNIILRTIMLPFILQGCRAKFTTRLNDQGGDKKEIPCWINWWWLHMLFLFREVAVKTRSCVLYSATLLCRHSVYRAVRPQLKTMTLDELCLELRRFKSV